MVAVIEGYNCVVDGEFTWGKMYTVNRFNDIVFNDNIIIFKYLKEYCSIDQVI